MRHIADIFARTCFCLTVASLVMLTIYLPPGAHAIRADAAGFDESGRGHHHRCGDLAAGIELGVFTDDGFVATTDVPLEVGTTFGWRLAVPDDRPVTFTEVLRTPAAPREWIGDSFSVSEDGRTAALADVLWPEDGVVHHAWVITEGDPAGLHEMRVRVDGGRERVMHFLVR